MGDRGGGHVRRPKSARPWGWRRTPWPRSAYRAREGLRQAFLQVHLQKLPAGDVHRDTVTKLGAYVRDGLSARDRRKVEEHLRECERCTALLLELQEVDTSLRGVLVPILLGVSATAYVAHLAAAAGGLGALLHWRPRSGPAKVAVAAGVAGSLLVAGLAIAAVSRGSGPSDRVAAGSPSSSTTTPTSTTAPSSTSPSTVPAPAVRATAPPPAVTIPPQPSPPASQAPVTVVPLFPSPTHAVRAGPGRIRLDVDDDQHGPALDDAAHAPRRRRLRRQPRRRRPHRPRCRRRSSACQSKRWDRRLPASARRCRSRSGASGPPFALGQSLAPRAASSGPVTVTAAGAPVADWGVAGCPPGPSCQLPIGTTSIVARIELASAVPATVRVTFRVSAPGVRAATASSRCRRRHRRRASSSPRPTWWCRHGGQHGDLPAPSLAPSTTTTATPLWSTSTRARRRSTRPRRTWQLPAGATVLHAVLNWGGEPAGALDPGPSTLSS